MDKAKIDWPTAIEQIAERFQTQAQAERRKASANTYTVVAYTLQALAEEMRAEAAPRRMEASE